MKKTKYILSLIAIGLSFNASAQNYSVSTTSNACKVHNQFPVPAETIEYIGECKDGFAEGKGKVNWFKDGKLHQISEGIFVKGKMEGECKMLIIGQTTAFSGICKNDLPLKGSYTDAKGIVYNGDFDDKGKPAPKVSK